MAVGLPKAWGRNEGCFDGAAILITINFIIIFRIPGVNGPVLFHHII
jgi:hypothetical protein